MANLTIAVQETTSACRHFFVYQIRLGGSLIDEKTDPSDARLIAAGAYRACKAMGLPVSQPHFYSMDGDDTPIRL